MFAKPLPCLALFATFAAASCGDSDSATPAPTPGFQVVVPASAGPGLRAAAQDLVDAYATIIGQSSVVSGVTDDAAPIAASDVVFVSILDGADAQAGEQGYRINLREMPSGSLGLTVAANTEIGALYGLYDIAGEMGVRYYHPEDTWFPFDEEARVPQTYSGELEVPAFELRGFHEHTQHPIVASDFYMRPGGEGFRDMASRYVRWLARNRQNALSFHLLKTVEMETWIPYIESIIDEAQSFGVRAGLVTSFADQQQNNYKYIQDGVDLPAETQIRNNLDTILGAGFDFVTVQIGTSEFTKPADAEALGWMNTAVGHVRDNFPNVQVYAWIHTTCDLEADGGGFYYHLPLQADTDLGAWVHTTMFYTLEHPAPVYECEDFHQQRDFFDAADGERAQVYFPETAWWLGFDNNAPVVLPLTGWSRAWDIQQELPKWDVEGHITFTTGREWTYWQYDHHLTLNTWDQDAGWDEYLDWIAPMYGPEGEAVAQALKDWTELQRQHIYVENPLIWFYISGELFQDEAGEAAGILARRPKRAFREILDLPPGEFTTWRESDLNMLERMRGEYAEVLGTLPETLSGGTDKQSVLYAEMRDALYVYVRRIEHIVALYSGVEAARAWVYADRENTSEEDLAALRATTMTSAMGFLSDAQAITTEMLGIFEAAEDRYRYPIELLARAKPDSLTAYPYGYLEQTTSGHFWTRRDDQLERLLALVFDESDDAWTSEPQLLFFTDSSRTSMIIPEDQLAGAVIAGFVPQLLFGLDAIDLDGGTLSLRIAQDANENLKPDGSTDQQIDGIINETSGEVRTWTGGAEAFPLEVRDGTGASLGVFDIFGVSFTLELGVQNGAVVALNASELDGEIESATLVTLVMSVGGIDEAGTQNLVKGVYGIELADPLPERLPIRFRFTFEPAR